MASSICYSSVAWAPNFSSNRPSVNLQPSYYGHKAFKIACSNIKNTTDSDSSSSTREGREGSEPENLILKAAWYGSELLGIAASYIRRSPPETVAAPPQETAELAVDGSGVIDRASVVETIKGDFQRSYFVTGLALGLIRFILRLLRFILVLLPPFHFVLTTVLFGRSFCFKIFISLVNQ